MNSRETAVLVALAVATVAVLWYTFVTIQELLLGILWVVGVGLALVLWYAATRERHRRG